MSDFDKIINDRLNEDDGEFFSRKEANWDKMSQRLAEFDKANPLPKDAPIPPMRTVWKRVAWSSAAAVLIGISGLLFWYFNEINDVKQQNAHLQEEVAALKLDKKAAQPEAILEKQNTVEGDVNNKTSTQSSGADKGFKKPETQGSVEKNTPSVWEEKKGRLDKNKQNAAIVDNKTPNSNNIRDKKTSPKDAVIQIKKDSQIAKMDNKKVLYAVPFDKNNAPLKSQKVQLADNMAIQTDANQSASGLETNKADDADNKQNGIAIAPKTDDNNVKTDRKNIENIETIAEIPPSVTNPIFDKNNDLEQAKTDVLALEKAKQDSLTQVLVVQQEAKTESESVAPPIIKTDGGLKRWRQFLPKGFAIGAQGVYASILPQIKGIKPTTGKGLSAELMFAKNISVVVTGDFLETCFELQERPRRFYLPDAPDPQKPNVGLHRIEGEQKSRLLSLNMKYVMGEKWWVQPFITLGHSWHKIDEHAVNFVFKDFTTGIQTPSSTKVNTEKVKNLWQAGVGLEKKIKRWTFGISAELQKDFSNPTDHNGNSIAANIGILRGGVKFNIF